MMKMPRLPAVAGIGLIWLVSCDATNTGSTMDNNAGNGSFLFGSGGSTTASSGGRGGASSSTTRGGTSTGGASAENTAVIANCKKACDTSYAKGCPSDLELPNTGCYDACDRVVDDDSGCDPEIEALFVCYGSQPSSSWACNASGYAALQAGLCQAETNALNTCTSM